MNKEILLVIDAVAHEKQVDKDIIISALEIALASATRKKNNKNADICVEINRDTGDYKTFRQWRILDDEVELMQFPDRELLYSRTKDEHPDKEIGDYIKEEIESIPFGRIAVQAAKQVIVQKVREAEREQVVEKFKDRIGEMLSGSVKRMDRGNIILDVGSNIEALISRDEMLPREQVRMGDRLRGYLKEVRQETRGPLLALSRTCPELLIELFTVEVPEIGDGLIEIKGAARDPGLRAKIAVKALDGRIDPVGACVGMRGSRVQVISNELAGERVDIILWDDSPAQFIINAMSPAEVSSIIVDEDSHSMDIAVNEEQLSQAIGRGGQNIKLASQLTGWTLNVMTEEEAAEKNDEESKKIINQLMDDLEVDEDVAFILANEGFVSVEEVAYVPIQDMLEIEEFDEEIVNALRERAQSVLLTRAISKEEQLSDADPDKDLYEVEGMDEKTAHKLASHGIITMEDLAEQAVDDLVEIDGITQEQAAKLIMAARKPWFEEAETES
ncbi:MAG: transcription termination/antitermination protein NusA [Gammaproteobacteria bacterium]|nr:transcription termination/antitermination protein NusA [Gammaproteobacteria bacterium]